MSARKMWALLASASTQVGVYEVRCDITDLFRLSHRRWKLAEGETGDGSADDEDSDNEANLQSGSEEDPEGDYSDDSDDSPRVR